MPVNDATKWYDKAPGEPSDGFITPADAQEAIKQIYLDLATVAQVAAVSSQVTGLVQQVTGLASPGELKAPVADKAALPATGNTDGDLVITLDDGHLHVWVDPAWNDIGPIATDKVPDGGNTGDIITWDGNIGEWVAVEPLLSTLHDVDGTVVPNDGDILVYDTGRGLWVMDAPAASGVSAADLDALKHQIGVNLRHAESVEAVLNTPPVLTAADAGRLWLVGTAPTGGFVGHANEVAQWDGSKWVFTTPAVNEARFDVEGGKIMHWATVAPATSPAWVDVLSGFLPLTGGTLTGRLTIASGANKYPVVINGAMIRVPAPDIIGFGQFALDDATAATSNCIALGASALQKTTGAENVGIGSHAGDENTTGTSQVFIGYGAGGNPNQKAGAYNVFIGDRSNTNSSSQPAQVNHAVAIGSSAIAMSESAAIGSRARCTAIKTVQLLSNATTGAKVYAGADQLVSKAEVKAMVAAAADWGAFKTAMASW